VKTLLFICFSLLLGVGLIVLLTILIIQLINSPVFPWFVKLWGRFQR
jgi:hypothetical protein